MADTGICCYQTNWTATAQNHPTSAQNHRQSTQVRILFILIYTTRGQCIRFVYFSLSNIDLSYLCISKYFMTFDPMTKRAHFVFYLSIPAFLCRLQSIATQRDHFVRCLSVHVCVCMSGSHTFLVVTHSYVLQATHAFLKMLPLCCQLNLHSYFRTRKSWYAYSFF